MNDVMDLETAIQDSFPAQDDDIVDDTDDIDDSDEKNTEGDDNKSGKKKEGEGDTKEGESDEKADKKMGDDEKKEGDDEKTDEKTDAKPKKKRNRFQERIDAKTRENYQLRREIEAIRAEKQNKEPELPPEPDLKDYYTPDGKQFDQRRYDFDTGQWRAKVESINVRNEERKQERITREFNTYNEKIKEDVAKYDDAHNACRTFVSYFESEGMLPDAFHNAFMALENPGEVVYFLGKNTQHLESLLNLSPYQQSMKLAELGVHIKRVLGKKKLKSNAPPPAAKIKGGKSGAPTKDISKMNSAQYMKHLGLT